MHVKRFAPVSLRPPRHLVGARCSIGDGGAGYPPRMFFFFSNRLGCFGSILISIVATLILLLIFGVLGGAGR